VLPLVCISAMAEEDVGSLNLRPVISSVGDSWMVRSLYRSKVDDEKMDWLR
jgi:hypothetical protein